MGGKFGEKNCEIFNKEYIKTCHLLIFASVKVPERNKKDGIKKENVLPKRGLDVTCTPLQLSPKLLHCIVAVDIVVGMHEEHFEM